MDKKIEYDDILNYVKNINIETIRFRSCSRPTKETEWTVKRHSHPHMELIYFFDAKAVIDVPGKSMYLDPYDLVVYPPGVFHQEFPDPRHSQELICITAYVDDNTSLETSFQIPDFNGVLRWLFEQIYSEWTKKQDAYSDIIANYLKNIFLLIQRHFQHYKPKSQDILNMSIQYIHEHFAEPITVEKLASRVFVSESYLSRLFHKRLGISPMRYLNMVRIEIAKKLLLTNGSTVSQTAFLVGFNDPLYFSRLFKRITNTSPTEYKNENIKY